ncbi:MAG: hypothetical protein WA419_18980 [Silvibacterium sp.]
MNIAITDSTTTTGSPLLAAENETAEKENEAQWDGILEEHPVDHFAGLFLRCYSLCFLWQV